MRRILLLALGASSFAAPLLAQQPPAPQPPRGGGMMQRMDTNGDGIVTRAEALAEAEQRFKAQDTDNNGIITAAERDAWMAQMRGGARGGGFGGRGGGGGGDQGTQTRAEFVERAGMRFDRMDANHDGKLDASELQMRGGRGRRGDMGPPPATPPVAPTPSN